MIDYKKILWSLAAMPLLASCTADEPLASGGNNDFVDDGNGVYMAVDLSFNSKGTRSFTNGDNSSNGGVEIGTAAENAVNSVLIVLADPNTNDYIASSFVDKKLSSMTAGEDKIYRANAKFSKTVINSYYSKLPANLTTNPSVNVFIYCNPTSAMQDAITDNADPTSTTKWYNTVYNLNADDKTSDNALWNAEKGFVMSNVSIAPRLLPLTMDDWNHYTSETKPFDLSGFNNPGQTDEVDNENEGRGAINVHRMAARFDFRDGSQMLDVPGCNGVEGVPFTYNVILDTDGESIVQAELVRMMMVNMGLSEYYLERVSSDGLTAGVTLLGAEQPWYSNANGTIIPNSGNYVVSPKADVINTAIESKFKNGFKFSDYFKYPFFTNAGQPSSQGALWGTSWLLKDVATKANDYSFWRYATENTIPGEADNQVNGVSTGVVFKAKIKATDKLLSSSDPNDLELYNALNNIGNKLGNPNTDPILYSFAGKLYATWNQVQEAALSAAGYDSSKESQNLDRSVSLYIACFGNGGAGTITIGGKTFTDDLDEDTSSANYGWTQWNQAGKPASGSTLTTFKSQVTGAGFTIYQSSDDEETGWGYYCYYYYWNRHNDNGKSGVMGPMEFGVVRNNVYKLAVTRLSTLGHPRVPENDPDSPTPDTPDEKSDLYITVSVKVMPWVVRVNHIEF